MARFLSSENKVLGLYESGLYSSTMTGSSFWIGQVTENSIDDNENPIETRYMGTNSRSYNVFDQGPRDVTGTLTYTPQDMRLVFWTIGSTYDVSGTTSIHYASEVDSDVRQNAFTSGTLNPPMSFTLEDSKQSPGTGANFIRTIKGVVPNVITISASQGEKVTCSLDYIGQTLSFSSGATTSVAERTNTGYLWNNVSLTIGGSAVETANSIDLEINQNIEAPHYLNGSRDISVPFGQNRNYTLSVTLDLNNPDGKKFYETYYKGGSDFNSVIDLNADNTTGSQHAQFILSGCKIISMDNPSVLEGSTESTLEIRPKNISATEWISNFSSGLFNPY